MTAPSPLLDVLVHERSLSRGLPYTSPPPEQFFNPTTYNFGEQTHTTSLIVSVAFGRFGRNGRLVQIGKPV